MRLLPIRAGRELTALIFRLVVSPVAGLRERISFNLDLVLSDTSQEARSAIISAVPANLGRTFSELFYGKRFLRQLRSIELNGDGTAEFLQCRAEGRPTLLVTGHIGNYDAIRGALLLKGHDVGGLYRPMNNKFFNALYVDTISTFGLPLFPRTRAGLGKMVKHLKSGGILGVVIDQFVQDGEPLNFFGHTAMTSTAIAELSLRCNAAIFPCYAIRRPDGSFDVTIENAVAKSSPTQMTQALNDSLEIKVRSHPDQWLWTHRRWKS